VYSLSHCAPNAPPSLPPPTELSIVDGPGASPPASEGPPRSAGVPELPPQPSKKKMKASAATRNMSTSGRLSIIVLRLGRYQGFPTPPTRTPDPGPVLFGIGVALLIRADSPKWAVPRSHVSVDILYWDVPLRLRCLAASPIPPCSGMHLSSGRWTIPLAVKRRIVVAGDEHFARGRRNKID
jgi:hypothetical protein